MISNDAFGLLVNPKLLFFSTNMRIRYLYNRSGCKTRAGHTLGLGHANFDGNLMAETVNDGTATVPECEINAVTTAND